MPCDYWNLPKSNRLTIGAHEGGANQVIIVRCFGVDTITSDATYD